MRQDVVHQYATGELIHDKYRLGTTLGRGGMGSVWQARNLALDSDVAIKIILNDERRVQLADRLVREARASARLNHQGIVRVFDVGTTAHGDAFLVMELLTGLSLADRLERDGRLAAVRAVQLFLPLIEALESAHNRGIIHRDLKPDNIFLAEVEGQLIPKVLDFGVAMDLNLGDNRITQAGTLLGSPAYMSPEQARGDVHIDHRTDIWSLCVALYEALTHETPFGDDGNYYLLLDRIVKDPPTPTTEYVAGDDALWLIIRRGLEKHVDDRWPSMHSLGVALAMWLESHEVAEDILGQGLYSTWLAPDSGNSRVSLVDAPAVSGRSHYSDRPTVRASGSISQSSMPPAERVSNSAHTTLASTLRPPTGQLSKRKRWLLPAGVAVVAVGTALAWHSISTPRAAGAGEPTHFGATRSAERPAAQPASGQAQRPAPSDSAEAASSTASASTEAPDSASAHVKITAQKSIPARTPATPNKGAPGPAPTLAPKAAQTSAPSPTPSAPKAAKPKLGDDLGF